MADMNVKKLSKKINNTIGMNHDILMMLFKLKKNNIKPLDIEVFLPIAQLVMYMLLSGLSKTSIKKIIPQMLKGKLDESIRERFVVINGSQYAMYSITPELLEKFFKPVYNELSRNIDNNKIKATSEIKRAKWNIDKINAKNIFFVFPDEFVFIATLVSSYCSEFLSNQMKDSLNKLIHFHTLDETTLDLYIELEKFYILMSLGQDFVKCNSERPGFINSKEYITTKRTYAYYEVFNLYLNEYGKGKIKKMPTIQEIVDESFDWLEAFDDPYSNWLQNILSSKHKSVMFTTGWGIANEVFSSICSNIKNKVNDKKDNSYEKLQRSSINNLEQLDSIIIENNPLNLHDWIFKNISIRDEPHVIFKWIYSIVKYFDELEITDEDLYKCFTNKNKSKLNKDAFFSVCQHLLQKEEAWAINKILVNKISNFNSFFGSRNYLENKIYNNEIHTDLIIEPDNDIFDNERRNEIINKINKAHLTKTINIINNHFITCSSAFKDSFNRFLEDDEYDDTLIALLAYLCFIDLSEEVMHDIIAEKIEKDECLLASAYIVCMAHIKIKNSLNGNLFGPNKPELDFIKVLNETAKEYNGSARWDEELKAIIKKERFTPEEKKILLYVSNEFYRKEYGEPIYKNKHAN